MNKLYYIVLSGLLLLSISCKKDKGETLDNSSKANSGSGSGSSTIYGCMDVNSPNFSPTATNDDGSCQYLYITSVEIVSFPADDNGADWDVLIQTEPDIYFRMKQSGEADWKLTTSRIDNASVSPLTPWSVSPPFKLTNANWVWEILDYDATSSHDLMDSGSFNPLVNGSNGVITSTSGNTTVKIYYSVI